MSLMKRRGYGHHRTHRFDSESWNERWLGRKTGWKILFLHQVATTRTTTITLSLYFHTQNRHHGRNNHRFVEICFQYMCYRPRQLIMIVAHPDPIQSLRQASPEKTLSWLQQMPRLDSASSSWRCVLYRMIQTSFHRVTPLLITLLDRTMKTRS